MGLRARARGGSGCVAWTVQGLGAYDLESGAWVSIFDVFAVFALLLFLVLVTLSTPPLPRDGSVVSRDQPMSPRYTPCILISRVGSALSHRVNSQQTNSVDYVVYSRSHAFHNGNQTLRRKNPNTTGIEPSFFPPRGGRRTSTPPGRGGTCGNIRPIPWTIVERWQGESPSSE